MPTKEQLTEMQGWSLEQKIKSTQTRILEWYLHYEGKVYVSFSGGKDSTVLLDLCRRVAPDMKALFVDTGLEYPEIKSFVKSFDNVDIIRPKMSFSQVISEYGYPLISKEVASAIRGARGYKRGENNSYIRYCKIYDYEAIKDRYGKRYCLEHWRELADSDIPISEQCCDVLKKNPAKQYEKDTGLKPILGTMASESSNREIKWKKSGCNAFDSTRPNSAPMSFWTEQDVLEYLYTFKRPYASVYGDIIKDDNGKFHTTGCNRTGCLFCGFGCHLEKEPNRFQMLKQTHPKLWEYCMKPDGLNLKRILDEIGVPTE